MAQLDQRYLTDTLVELAKIPTEVPRGPEVFIEPDHPKLVHYVQHVLRRSKLHALGDDPKQVVHDVRQAIGDLAPYQICVERGQPMLPALGDPVHPGVVALKEAHRQVRGTEVETYYGQGSYDAGGPCAPGYQP